MTSYPKSVCEGSENPCQDTECKSCECETKHNQQEKVDKNSLTPTSNNTNSSHTVVTGCEDESDKYPPEKLEKRRLSLDFFFGRRSSHGKLKISREKRGSNASITEASNEENPAMHPSHERRRSSTRMEGNSDLVAWCFI